MSNRSSSVSDKGLSTWEKALLSKGAVSKHLDRVNKVHDDRIGKTKLSEDLQEIRNRDYAEMKMMHSQIPGFKK